MSQDYALLSRRGRFLLHRETWAFLGGALFGILVMWMQRQTSADYHYYLQALGAERRMAEASDRIDVSQRRLIQECGHTLNTLEAERRTYHPVRVERSKWTTPRWGMQPVP